MALSRSSSDNIPINYQPHFHTLTKAGERNFSNLKDALCELCDNAIEATKDCAEKARDVKVILSVSPRTEGTYIIVWDNGTGMDVDQITDFATYAYSRKER